MQFKYTAITPENKRVNGSIEASSKSAAIFLIKQQKLIPISVSSRREALSTFSIFKTDLGGNIFKAKISKKKLLIFCQQMGIMLKAGVSLSLALEVMVDGEKDTNIRRILMEMQKDLLAGVSLSDSMAKFRAFTEIVVNMVASGEVDGNLGRSFEQTAHILEKELAISGKLKSAMIYPIILLIMTVGLLVVMNTMVLPTFISLFKQLHAPLPALTVFVISASEFMSHFWYVILAVIFLAVLAYRLARRQAESFCIGIDGIKLKLPLAGRLLTESYLARFCRVMSSLTGSGADIIVSLRICRNIIPNAYVKEQIRLVSEDVRIGMSVHESMARYGFFSSLVISMVRVGEESGYLSETLEHMAEMYETQTEDTSKRLTIMMEPLMTVIIAGIVGTVIISIVMPMFGMYSIIS